MRRIIHGSDERGASLIIVAVFMTCLIGGAGLSIDAGSLAFQRSRVQHSADSAALSIAQDCINKKVTECSSGGAQSSADYYAVQNSDGGTGSIPGGVTLTSTSVSVQIDKTIKTNFFKALPGGPASKNVAARSTADWSTHPVSGPVIPFAISLCEYEKVAVGTPTFISTNVEAKVLDPFGRGLTSVVYPALAPYMLQNCAVPAGVSLPGSPSVVSMLKGGLWLSDNGSSTNNGNLINTAVLDTLNGGYNFQMNQPRQFTQYFAAGQTMLMAVYAPVINYPESGLKTTGTGATQTTNGEVRLMLIGYTPFIPTGWCLGDQRGNMGACGGAAPSQVGIAGKFTSTSITVPGFVYGGAGGGFGAYHIKLTQ